MKKLFTFLLLAGMFAGVQAQVFVYEDFSANQMPPSGWNIDTLAAQWSVSQSSLCNGYVWWAVPEGKFTFTGTSTVAITRLISPVIDLTGLTSIKMHFQYYYQFHQSPAPRAAVATRSAGGAWTRVWSVSPGSNNGPKDIDLTITNSDVGSSQFQFCLYLDGDLFNISYWYIDNIVLTNPLANDGFLSSIYTTPSYIAAPAPVSGRITNTGSSAITSAVVDWQIDNGTVHSTALTGLSVQPFKFYDFTCTELMDPPPGSHNLVVWIREINGSPDDYQPNDTLSKNVQMVSGQVNRKPLFEECTSSSCVICPEVDDILNPWYDSIGEAITLVKYQMDFPGSGDPYYTAEAGVRGDFYNINGVPDVRCDGRGPVGNVGINGVTQAFLQESQEPGMMMVSCTHSFTGHAVTVNATVLPYANFTSLRLCIAVIEEITYNNASTSSDTSFIHVMMKMIPDANGTPLNLEDQQPYTFTATADLEGTFIERWDDLKVVAWVQDTVRTFVYPYWKKLVYQSCYSVETAPLATEARLANILVNSAGVADFNSDKFSYSVELPAGTVMVPDVKGIPIDTNETVVVTPAQSIPGTTNIDVYAQNNINHNLYTVGFTLPNGIDGLPSTVISVYPNPVADRLFITGANHCPIQLFSSTGEEVKNAESFTGGSISLTGLQRGIYMLKIIQPAGGVVLKKIVVQ